MHVPRETAHVVDVKWLSLAISLVESFPSQTMVLYCCYCDTENRSDVSVVCFYVNKIC